MRDKRRDITGYSEYFTMGVPGAPVQVVLLIVLGCVAGITSSLVVHYNSTTNINNLLLAGASSGILVITLPSMLTVVLLKVIARKLKLKHAMFAVGAVALAYSLFMVCDAVLYHALQNQQLPYLLLILINAAIYLYWLFVNKVAIGQKKSAIVTASIQPILNVMFFIPLGSYIMTFKMPVDAIVIKLYSGMFVFLAIGYLMLYLLDRPAKKQLKISSVAFFSSMVGQWLFDITDNKILGTQGVKRDVSVDVLILKGKKEFKAIFVKPDIHYGPYGNIGGSVTTEYMGNKLFGKYNATPFVVHGAVNIDDNPLSAQQIESMSRRVCDFIDNFNKAEMIDAKGYVNYGKSLPCRAINVRINDLNLLTLSKAPFVTEDINRYVGRHFERIATMDNSRVMLIDAHNTRYESAGDDELRGIYKGSKYVTKYEKAIKEAAEGANASRLRFGAAHRKLRECFKTNVDLGPGYTSVGIFEFNHKKFAMIYFDANNMLPGFRTAIVSKIKEKYGIDAELYTTDTHAVNSIAQPASNALGRNSRISDIAPVVCDMIEEALASMEYVKAGYGSFMIEGFSTWGAGVEDLITQVGSEVIGISKHVLPFIIVAGFIIAAWIIYIV